MDYQANTQSTIKQNNQKIILHLLVNEGPMSRAELAKKMNSSKPTISKNVEELILENKIIEVGKGDNLVGKKGMLLDVNPKYGYVLAIDLSKNMFNAVLANLRNEWIYEYSQSIEEWFEEDSQGSFTALSLLQEFFEGNKIDLSKIMLVSIAYPGVVGHNDSVYLTNLKFKENLLSELIPFIKNVLQKPLIIKNDINLAAIAEKRYGRFTQMENLYLLSADVGVGLGIIIKHQLYEGDRNAAGEVGFVLPLQRKNGQYYTLEDRVSIHALTKRYTKIKGKPTDFEMLLADIKSGKNKALNLYEDIINDVSVAVSNIASILDIKTVILEGRLFDLKENMVEELNAQIKKMTPFETVVTRTTLQKKSLIGAVIVGVEVLIDKMIM